MSISCADGKHVALPRPIRNQGFDFGRCRSCGRDLVRSGRAWRTVPAGFRVVWRRDPPGAAVAGAAQLRLKLDLPERRLPRAPAAPGPGSPPASRSPCSACAASPPRLPSGRGSG